MSLLEKSFQKISSSSIISIIYHEKLICMMITAGVDAKTSRLKINTNVFLNKYVLEE